MPDDSVETLDPELTALIFKEQERQKRGVNLTASENYVYKYVMQVSGSCLMNKYAEGYPGARYYGSCQYIDQIERLCIKRALNLYGLD